MRMTFKRIAGLGPLLVSSVAAVALSGALYVRVSGDAAPVVAAPAAATACPPQGFANNLNLAKNPGFEMVGPNGTPVVWQAGNPIPPPSAARNWLMHSDNQGSTVKSRLVPSNVPGPGGLRMLQFIAGGKESGPLQILQPSPPKLMFSAWVYVRRGQVALSAHQFSVGQPVAWSTKLNQWEQLRVCTDGTAPTGFFSIYNQTPTGGDFFVDRVEIRETQ